MDDNVDRNHPNYKPKGHKWCNKCGGLHPRRAESKATGGLFSSLFGGGGMGKFGPPDPCPLELVVKARGTRPPVYRRPGIAKPQRATRRIGRRKAAIA